MKSYFLARNNETEIFSVFESVDGLVQRCYPHTEDSETYAELQNLISSNDPRVEYGSIAEAEKLVWKPISLEVVAENVRAARNELLSNSDWTQVLDSPVDRTSWSLYRQALRDITAQPGFPMDVQWPNKPE